jgi:hypothetical protein
VAKTPDASQWLLIAQNLKPFVVSSQAMVKDGIVEDGDRIMPQLPICLEKAYEFIFGILIAHDRYRLAPQPCAVQDALDQDPHERSRKQQTHEDQGQKQAREQVSDLEAQGEYREYSEGAKGSIGVTA